MRINELLAIGVLLTAVVLFNNPAVAADGDVCQQRGEQAGGVECAASDDAGGGYLIALAGKHTQGRFILLREELSYSGTEPTATPSKAGGVPRPMPGSLIGAILGLMGVVAIARRNNGAR